MKAKAARHLAEADPALGAWIARIGPLEPRPRDHDQPYEALLSAVAHQQLHGNAARAMLGRLQALTAGAHAGQAPAGQALPAPAALLALTDAQLRACGFSANKAAALRDIAANAAAGVIPSRAAAYCLSDPQLIERLTAVRGVGRWTVEMLLIFTLRRPDVFPVDDFAVREGYRIAHGLAAQPKPKALALHAQAYAPYRSTAALYCWRIADLGKPVKAAKRSAKSAVVAPPED